MCLKFKFSSDINKELIPNLWDAIRDYRNTDEAIQNIIDECDEFIFIEENNFWNILNTCKLYFATIHNIPIAHLGLNFTSDAKEYWFDDKIQLHLIIEPMVGAPYPNLDL